MASPALQGDSLESAAVNVAVTTSTARSAQLASGHYLVTADDDCHVRQGGSSVDATTSDYLVRATDPPIRIGVRGGSDADDYVAGIVATGSTTLRIVRVSR